MLRSLDEPTVALLREREERRNRHGGRDARSTPAWRWRDLDGSGSAARLAAIDDAVEPRLARTCGTGSHPSSRKSPDGTFVESDAAVRTAAAEGAQRIDDCAGALLGDRNALLWPQPRIGARAGRDRARHHVRRDGRHQHGPRRADDARRLHDLSRAGGDAAAPRRVDSRRDSGGVRRRRRSPAC